jgi:hypothetical protein
VGDARLSCGGESPRTTVRCSGRRSRQILRAGADLQESARELQPLCDVGMACDFTLRDATCRSAVLIGASSTALIVDG